TSAPGLPRGKRPRGAQRAFVLDPPLGAHVRAEVGGRHHGARRTFGSAMTHRYDVPEEAGRAPRIHHVRDAALEVRVAFAQPRYTQCAEPVRHGGELVTRAPAR